jgi:predicted DNA-binding transcriptional regulator YafY
MKPDLERKFALLNLLASSLEPPIYQEIFEKLPEFYQTQRRDLASVKKMFERDKDDLTKDGFAVVAIVGADGEDRYVIPKHQGWLRDFQLTASQSQVLREAIEDRAVTGQMTSSGLFALKKLLALSAPFDENLRGEEAEDPEAVAHFVKAHEALLARKVINVDYPNHQGRPETRDFSPYALFFRFGQAFLVVGCHRTKTPKVIALDRVENLSISSKTRFLPPPADFDPNQYIQTGRYDYDKSLGTYVQFRVAAQELDRVKRRYPQIVVSIDKKGSALCEYFVTNDEAFIEWMLSFGPNVEILTPTSYRLKFKRFVEKAVP